MGGKHKEVQPGFQLGCVLAPGMDFQGGEAEAAGGALGLHWADDCHTRSPGCGKGTMTHGSSVSEGLEHIHLSRGMVARVLRACPCFQVTAWNTTRLHPCGDW